MISLQLSILSVAEGHADSMLLRGFLNPCPSISFLARLRYEVSGTLQSIDSLGLAISILTTRRPTLDSPSIQNTQYVSQPCLPPSLAPWWVQTLL